MTTTIVFTYCKDSLREITLKEEGFAVLLGRDDDRLRHEDGSLWDAMDLETHGSLVKNGPNKVSINIYNSEFLGRNYGFPNIISVMHTMSPEQ